MDNKAEESILFRYANDKKIHNNLNYLNIISLSKKTKKFVKRNLGIDFARIISMFFIINHHIIYHGGPLFRTRRLSFRNNLFLFLNIIYCSGVNIFGMISGFVGFHSHKFSNLIYLLFQTSFYNYCFRFFFKFYLLKTTENLNYLIYPVFISGYWYFNAYFSLYFFLPLINKGIKSMEQREMGIFNLSLFLLFSCFNQIRHYSKRLNKDFFFFNNGFTYMWLVILYFYGSYFGRFTNDNHGYKQCNIILICITIACFMAIIRTAIINKLNNKTNINKMRVEYTSPSSVIIAICFLNMFSGLKIKSKGLLKLIIFFSPLTYGIYLAHNHSLILKYLIKNKYTWLLNYNIYKFNLLEILEGLKIFIICSFVDYLRLLLFY